VSIPTSFFDAGTTAIQALYASDPRQGPFLNAGCRRRNRWMIDLSLQINPVVTMPQRFADNGGADNHQCRASLIP